jgi:hypothetical protein
MANLLTGEPWTPEGKSSALQEEPSTLARDVVAGLTDETVDVDDDAARGLERVLLRQRHEARVGYGARDRIRQRRGACDRLTFWSVCVTFGSKLG